MRYKKTPSISAKRKAELKAEMERCPECSDIIRKQDPRATYKQLDEDGHVIAEFDPMNDTTMNLSKEEKEELTLAMHRVDDAEARCNCKERLLNPYDKEQLQKRRNQFIEEFEAHYGYRPHPEDCPSISRRYVSLDEILDCQDDERSISRDMLHIQQILSDDPFAEFFAETAVLWMRHLVKQFTPREQEVYWIVFHEEQTHAKAARKLNISERRVGQIVQDITRKLKNDKNLKKIFRYPSDS